MLARSLRRNVLRSRLSLAARTSSTEADLQKNTFLGGTQASYAELQYESWLHDPSSVHPSWAAFFRSGDYQAPPTLGGPASPAAASSTGGGGYSLDDARKIAQVSQLIRNYEVHGHYKADLDPLKIRSSGIDRHDELPPKLHLENYLFSAQDMDRVFPTLPNVDNPGFESAPMTLKETLQRLEETYCGRIGLEFMHIANVDECNYIREMVETPSNFTFSKEEKLRILDRMTWADHFEQFLALKYPAQKRFGLDGCEALIPGMKALIDEGANLGIDNVVMGMPHRGRLNVLGNVVRKPLEHIFKEFKGSVIDDQPLGSGDVKYHLGMSYTRPTYAGRSVHLSLVANPSHLEAVNPVVVGKTRAKQHYSRDLKRERHMAVLLHGDAAFSGQGIVYETMELGDLPDYTTGGTIHIVVNNQIGFTTDPRVARSSPYCTDVARAVNAPIFHVNADDPEAVVQTCKWAINFRQKFKKDVVIDMVCYRRFGHNEGDEPKFTQPTMYSKIEKHPPTLDMYKDKLVGEGSISADEAQAISDQTKAILHEKFELAKEHISSQRDWLENQWSGLLGRDQYSAPRDTGVDFDTLRGIGKKITTLPEDFKLHRRLKKIMSEKQKMMDSGEGFDWGTAESLAFGSLLQEGFHVRLSGQDVERGTFSHRHAKLHDQTPGSSKTFTPLDQLTGDLEDFSVSNSPLAEFSVLGFELGYSLENPNGLVLWEAQFGDFFNGAQVIVDQFISSGESKWLRQSGLVMLLPHGYEGGGPEHSSGRMERFLQMCDDNPYVLPDTDPETSHRLQEVNWQVVNCSTPANYFHVLRRQMNRGFRKPLIVFSPKSLLKLRDCVSGMDEMGPGTNFQTVIPDHTTDLVAPEKMRKVVFCTGKVYYDLLKERNTQDIKDVALVRVEQLCPFPYEKVAEQVAKFGDAELLWCQEEPMNMGAWHYIEPRFETALKHVNGSRVSYAGRMPSGAPATGLGKSVHDAELQALMDKAFS